MDALIGDVGNTGAAELSCSVSALLVVVDFISNKRGKSTGVVISSGITVSTGLTVSCSGGVLFFI